MGIRIRSLLRQLHRGHLRLASHCLRRYRVLFDVSLTPVHHSSKQMFSDKLAHQEIAVISSSPIPL